MEPSVFDVAPDSSVGTIAAPDGLDLPAVGLLSCGDLAAAASGATASSGQRRRKRAARKPTVSQHVSWRAAIDEAHRVCPLQDSLRLCYLRDGSVDESLADANRSGPFGTIGSLDALAKGFDLWVVAEAAAARAAEELTGLGFFGWTMYDYDSHCFVPHPLAQTPDLALASRAAVCAMSDLLVQAESVVMTSATRAGDAAASRARGAALAWLVDNLGIAHDAGVRAAVRVLMLRLCYIEDDDSQSPLGPATVYRVNSPSGATACADGEPYLHFRCGVCLVGWAVGKSVVIALPKSLHRRARYFADPQKLRARHLVDITCGQRDWFDRRYEPEVTIAMYQLGGQCIAAEGYHHLYIPAPASEYSLCGAAVGEFWQLEFPAGGSRGSEAEAEGHDEVADACEAEGCDDAADEYDAETFPAPDDV